MSDIHPFTLKLVERLVFLVAVPNVRSYLRDITDSWLKQRKDRVGGPLVPLQMREDRDWEKFYLTAETRPAPTHDIGKDVGLDKRRTVHVDVMPEKLSLEGKYALLTALHDDNANGTDVILDLEPLTFENPLEAKDMEQAKLRAAYEVLKIEANTLAKKDPTLLLGYFTTVCLNLREKGFATCEGVEQWVGRTLDEVRREPPTRQNQRPLPSAPPAPANLQTVPPGLADEPAPEPASNDVTGSLADPPHLPAPIREAVEDSSSSPLSASDLAKMLRNERRGGATDDAVDAWLRRYRKDYDHCYDVNPAPRRNEPKYLYHVGDVLPHLRQHFRSDD